MCSAVIYCPRPWPSTAAAVEESAADVVRHAGLAFPLCAVVLLTLLWIRARLRGAPLPAEVHVAICCGIRPLRRTADRHRLLQLFASNDTETPPFDTDGLEDRVWDAVLGPCQVHPGTPLLLCVSGGVDSLALLHLLARGRDRQPPAGRCPLHVVNFNHRLRAESAAEAELVQRWAAHYQIPCEVHAWAHESLGIDVRHGMQAKARAWRRVECQRLLERLGPGACVVTAHHADDQMETIALRLLRGVHISRIEGIGFRHGTYVRPLLDLRKTELLTYMQTLSLPWMEDVSNAVPKYRRNRVRLQLLPLLAELAGGPDALQRRAAELVEQSAAVREVVRRERKAAGFERTAGGPALKLDDCFRQLSGLSRTAIIHDFVAHHCQFDLSYHQTLRLTDLATGPQPVHGGTAAMDLGHDWMASRVGDLLRLDRTTPGPPPASTCTVLDWDGRPLPVTHPPDVVVQVVRDNQDGEDLRPGSPPDPLPAGAWAATPLQLAPARWRLFDLPAGVQLEVRRCREGDRFHPPWRPHPITITQFLRGRNTPLHLRQAALVLSLRDASITQPSAPPVPVAAVWPSFVSKEFHRDAGRPALVVEVLPRPDPLDDETLGVDDG
eukprot:EG_transcript_5588